MSFDVDAYINDLLVDSGLEGEQLEAVKGALAQDTVAQRLKRDVLAREDYSRNMDKLSQEEQRLMELGTILSEQVDQNHNNKSYVTQLEQELQTYKSGNSSPSYLDDDEVDLRKLDDVIERKVSERVDRLPRPVDEQKLLRLIADTNKIAINHYKEFEETLDPQELYKFTLKQGLPIDAAYDRLVKERRDERQQQRIKDQIRQAREEGIQEGRSMVKFPSLDNRSGHVFAEGAPKSGGADAAAKEFMEAIAGRE